MTKAKVATAMTSELKIYPPPDRNMAGFFRQLKVLTSEHETHGKVK
jgi:hypothetical protein